MTDFEKKLQDSLRDFQPDLSGQEKSWNNVQKALNAKKRAKYFYGIAATALVAVSAFALWPSAKNLKLPESINQPDSNEFVTPLTKETPKEIESTQTTYKVDKASGTIPVTDNQQNVEITPSSVVDSVYEEPKVTEVLPEEKTPSDNNNFFAEITVNNHQVCPGEKLQFHLNTKEPVMVEWTFSNGVKSEEPNPSFTATKAGKYAASAKLTSLVSGKEKTIYVEDGFEIFPKSNYSIAVDEVRSDNFERKYHLNVEGSNIISVNWIGIEKDDQELKVELNERGNYQYTAEVFDQNGCKTVLSTNFDVETDNNLLAPTAFTPNGDEVNDDFLPKALHQLDDGKFLFRIINPATGKILFETNSSSRSWDGTNPETGTKFNSGTYVWTAIIFGSKGNKTFNGKVSIVD